MCTQSPLTARDPVVSYPSSHLESAEMSLLGSTFSPTTPTLINLLEKVFQVMFFFSYISEHNGISTICSSTSVSQILFRTCPFLPAPPSPASTPLAGDGDNSFLILSPTFLPTFTFYFIPTVINSFPNVSSASHFHMPAQAVGDGRAPCWVGL